MSLHIGALDRRGVGFLLVEISHLFEIIARVLPSCFAKPLMLTTRRYSSIAHRRVNKRKGVEGRNFEDHFCCSLCLSQQVCMESEAQKHYTNFQFESIEWGRLRLAKGRLSAVCMRVFLSSVEEVPLRCIFRIHTGTAKMILQNVAFNPPYLNQPWSVGDHSCHEQRDGGVWLRRVRTRRTNRRRFVKTRNER